MQLVTMIDPKNPNEDGYRMYTYTPERTTKLGIPRHVAAWCISNNIRISSHWHPHDEYEGWQCTNNLILNFLTKKEYEDLKRKENNKGAVNELKTEVLFD